jgi:hypothetical protein
VTPRQRAALLAALLGLLGLVLWWRRGAFESLAGDRASPAAVRPADASRKPFEPSAESLSFGHDTISATIDTYGRTALDGMDLDAIVAFRRAKVAEHAQLALFPSLYDPLAGGSRRIWSSITPGAKWLGPTAYYVANPYVLVVMVRANRVTPLSLFCPEVVLRYTHRRIEEIHDGASADCWLDRAFSPGYGNDPGLLRVVMVNAYDAGLHYAHVDLAESRNVGPEPSPASVVNALFGQSSFFHVGRYHANNISPEDSSGWIHLLDRSVATRIHVKLWVERPDSTAAPADMTYVVDVAPAAQGG